MRQLYPASLITLLILTSPSHVLAQTYTTKEVDARIENQLYEVLKLGTDIYNRGSHDACYRLYQGCLLSVAGFLDHRPEQQAKVQKALKEADALFNVKDRAFALRDAIDDVRSAIKATHSASPTKPNASTPTTPAKPTLWQRLGGELSVTLIAEDWVNRALNDPRINFTRRGSGGEWAANPENVSKLKKQFVFMLSSITGGSLKYEGKSLKEAHAKMKITDVEFDALLFNLSAALDKFFVSPAEKDELVKAINMTRKDIVDPATLGKSLWDRVGGEPAMIVLVDDFVNLAVKNPLVNFSRKGIVRGWQGTPDQMSMLKRRMLQYMSSITNGPLTYDGKSMQATHEGMKITDAEYQALVIDLKASMERVKINPREQEDLLKAIEAVRKDIVEKK